MDVLSLAVIVGSHLALDLSAGCSEPTLKYTKDWLIPAMAGQKSPARLKRGKALSIHPVGTEGRCSHVTEGCNRKGLGSCGLQATAVFLLLGAVLVLVLTDKISSVARDLQLEVVKRLPGAGYSTYKQPHAGQESEWTLYCGSTMWKRYFSARPIAISGTRRGLVPQQVL